MEGFRHILVDGWNVIHAEPALKSILTGGSQEAARAALRERLAPLHDFSGTRLTIVYDGTGDEISIERKDKILSFSEVFTPSSMTADELIEQLCATSKNPSQLLVVTRDNLLRLTASSFGALSVKPENVLEWSEESRKNISETTRKNNFKTSREWKKESPFDKLDILAADLNSAMQSSPLLSKRLRKRLKHAAEENHEKKSATDAGTCASKQPQKPPAQKPRRPTLGGGAPSAKALSDLRKVFDFSAQKNQPKRGKNAK